MLNKIIIMGRLTKDPEIKRTSSDLDVCTFTVAVNRRIIKKDAEKQADFINCVAWEAAARFIGKYFRKGRMINVVGRLQTRNWEDQDGIRHYVAEVIAEEVNFCGEKKAEVNPAEDFALYTDDDLPF